MDLSPRGRIRSRHVRGKSTQMVDSELTMIADSVGSSVSAVDSVVETLREEIDELGNVLQDSVAAACCVKDYDLHHYMHLPDYLKHNPHITHGYRVNLSLRQTTFSFFHWHNETLNVWTHFAGFVLFLILALLSYATWLNRATLGEIITSTVFFLSAMMMMLFSTIFHLYNCCSSGHYDFTAKLDYSGIAVLIVGSYYPLLYYIYSCPDQWMWKYGYGLIITAFGAAALFTVWQGKMHTPGTEAFRLFIFLGMGLFGVIPLPQSIVRALVHHLT
jgi:adiponectin receptor